MLPGTMAVVRPVPSVDRRHGLLNALENAVGARNFQHWFIDKTQVEIDDDRVLFRVSSQFQQTWMQRRFGADINQCVQDVIGARDVHWVIDRDFNVAQTATLDNATNVLKVEATSTPNSAPLVSVERPGCITNPKRERGTAKPADISSPSPTTSPSLTLWASNASAPAGPLNAEPRAALREGRKYAGLDEFVIGRGNELAATAARHVIDQPGASCNPLYLHGPVGTGKTHLAEAIYKGLRKSHSNLRLLFMTAEAFANQFTHALRNHSLPSFRQRFRSVDVLFIDDADFFNGKRGIQEEFLHTFQQLTSHGKQVVLTSDTHPRLLNQTCDELVSRFLSGLVCRLEAPDYETRRKIAHSKAISCGASIADDVLDLVARRFVNNVREVEGAINTLQAWFRMTGKLITLPVAKQVLADLERDCVRVVKLTDIETVVCSLFGMQSDDLRSDRRTRSVSQPRMLAMYLARKHTQAAYKEIGEFFGGRNHSTVMAAERKIDSWLRTGDDIMIGSQTWRLSELVERLEQQLLAS